MNRLAIFFSTIALIGILCCPQYGVAQSDPGEESTTIFLVRHAEKKISKNKDPRLSLKGKERAQLLAKMLGSTEIDIIFSTDYKRTRNTVAPLALILNKEVMLYDPRDNTFSSRLIDEYKGKKILVVGHSNTTPFLVNQLIGRNKYTQLDDDEYSKMFVVILSKATVEEFILTY